MMSEKLTPEKIRELWGKTYNTEGKPDWSHLFPYYHEAVVFQDSIQRIEGIEAFKAMCARLGSGPTARLGFPSRSSRANWQPTGR